jgi:alkaline phosphatase
MLKQLMLFVLVLSTATHVFAQPQHYSVDNAHSHNDYEQRIPFWMAYNAGFGSIEADIFLVDTALYVAHDKKELLRKIKLNSEYLDPIVSCLRKNNGFPYPDHNKELQLLIDIKTDSIHTLEALIRLLEKYPELIHCKNLRWIITGNRPDESLFAGYPEYIRFDGELHKNYSKNALKKISLLSDDFKTYSLWGGTGNLSKEDLPVLNGAVKKAHDLHQPVRFWDAPDNPDAWRQLMNLKVDYINTDLIQELSDFLH